MTVYYISCGYE